jgi:hypothetical protein
MTAEVAHRSVQVPATTPTYQTVSGYPEAVFLCLLSVVCRQSVAACCALLGAFLTRDVEFLGIFWGFKAAFTQEKPPVRLAPVSIARRYS